jgi:dethiobiotin synthetase
MQGSWFISATDTGVGKTFVANLLIKEAAKTIPEQEIAYYKPIQCGEDTDMDYIQRQNPRINVYCTYNLKHPSAPDFAAKLEGIEISTQKIKHDFEAIRSKHQFVIVEGAGGLAVPLNDKELISDLIVGLGIPLLLVLRPDLGTINHTSLSVEHARARGINIKALIIAESTLPDAYPDAKFKDEQQAAVSAAISRQTGLPAFKISSLYIPK